MSLFILFTSQPLTLQLFLIGTAAAASTVEQVAMLVAPAFPVTAWYDPEFKDNLLTISRLPATTRSQARTMGLVTHAVACFDGERAVAVPLPKGYPVKAVSSDESPTDQSCRRPPIGTSHMLLCYFVV